MNLLRSMRLLGRPDFTSDWTSPHFPVWRKVLRPLARRPVTVLEIGSFEGRSALFFLDHLRFSNLTCVDTFHRPGAERRFDDNLRRYRKRLRKMRMRSAQALDILLQERRSFSLIYIDGGHTRQAVFADTVMAWPLLEVGGILIWDDYEWQPNWPLAQRPQAAIDLFLATFGCCLEPVTKGYQVIVRKTAEWPGDPVISKAAGR